MTGIAAVLVELVFWSLLLLVRFVFSFSSLYEHSTIKKQQLYLFFFQVRSSIHPNVITEHGSLNTSCAICLYMVKAFFLSLPVVEVGNEWCFDIDKMRVQSSNSSFCSHERSLLHGDNQVFSLSKWVTLVWCAVTVSFTTFPQKYLIHCPLKFKSSVAYT